MYTALGQIWHVIAERGKAKSIWTNETIALRARRVRKIDLAKPQPARTCQIWRRAVYLIAGLTAEQLLADKGYDSDTIVEQAKSQGMEVVIPPRKNRRNRREYDKDLYKLRHLVERAFLHLKRWRGRATRYAKNAASFLAAVHIRCIAMWAGVSWRRYLKEIL